MSNTSDYLEAKLLDHSLGTTAFTMPTNVYLSLHTASPTDTGGSEVTGGSYARQAITWSAASSPAGTKTNNAVVTFTAMPAVTSTHIGIYDASSAGNLLYWGPLTSSIITNSGDTVKFNASSITVTMA